MFRSDGERPTNGVASSGTYLVEYVAYTVLASSSNHNIKLLSIQYPFARIEY
jgi:hypothetical protein